MNYLEKLSFFITDNPCTPSHSFDIQGNPAHGIGPSIPIAIGDIRNIKILNEDTFPKVCGIIQKTTLTKYYPGGGSRDNHNGTHSARQARMFEVWLDAMETGSHKEIALSLTEEEKMHLKLGAFLLRSGRVDESSHLDSNPDDYYTRSAMIYEAYANQLQASKETVAWVKHLIINSCKPKGIRDSDIDANPKNKFGYDALSAVHELDLIRCFSKWRIEEVNKPSVKEILSAYFPQEKTEPLGEKLFEFSKRLCEATGCYRSYDGHLGNASLFSLCSSNGEKCWEAVKNTPFLG